PVNTNNAAFRATHCMLLGSLLVLAACSSGGSVNIGKSQGADPGTVDFPIAYVKHYFDAQGDAQTGFQKFDAVNNPGRTRRPAPDADLFLRSSASPSATEIDITGAITSNGNYDIKDVDVSPDGTKLIFAMRGPIPTTNFNERRAPFWTLWEYDIPTASLHEV